MSLNQGYCPHAASMYVYVDCVAVLYLTCSKKEGHQHVIAFVSNVWERKWKKGMSM